jgi:signal transduction histidine kinase
VNPVFRNRRLLAAGIYLILYLLLEWLCYVRPMLAPGITPWHPQAGLTLAFLFVIGPEWCVITAIGAFVGQFAFHPTHVSVAAIFAGSVWIALVYAALTTLMRQVLAKGSLRTTADTARLAGAAGIATLVTAAGYLGTFIVSAEVSPADALRGFARYWFADLNGVLMVAPLLLLGDWRAALTRALRRQRLEMSAQFALVLGILLVIFALPDNEQLRFFYLLFVPVIWIALRWDWMGALLAVLVIQAGLIFAAEADIHTPRFIDTQLLMLTLSLTALLLGSVVAERRWSEMRLRERDAELARAMRFAVAGELASATAHELNQPMTALVSYLNSAEMLARSPAADEERLRDTVRKAAEEAMRASQVLRRLRNFYSGGQARRDKVRLAALCDSVAIAFADRLRRGAITLDVMVDPALPELEVDETQLQIVLHNLLANAVDATALQAKPEKRIEVSASIDEHQAMIVVEDSGAGVSSQVADRLFEPFVTSKPDGMGLGLAISRSLVRASGGELTCLTAGRLGGARMQVVLPIKVGGQEGDS